MKGRITIFLHGFNLFFLSQRHEQAEEGGVECAVGPHMTLTYRDKSLLDDAANLIIHHVRRQTAIHKDDKGRIKGLVRHLLPDLFFHPRGELSDDENDNQGKRGCYSL